MSVYSDERKIITTARDTQPNLPAKTLAKELALTAGLGGRSFYSIYSVIRRYDAKLRDAKVAAITKKYATV